MVAITPSEFKILRYIELNGPSTGYDMSKKKGSPPVVSDKVAYTLLPRLVKKGLLSVVTKKTGTRLKKEYSLTVLGLATALIDSQVRENLDTVIDFWGHLLPLVLGKWDFFGSAGVEDLAWRKLDVAIGRQITGTQYTPHRMSLDYPTDPAEVFHHNFYHPEIGLNDREERLRWAEACAMDEEVHDYLIEKLMMIIEGYEVMACETGLMLRTHQGKDED